MVARVQSAAARSVLVVESEWLTARDIRTALADIGHLVMVVGSAEAALDFVAAHRPDLVLLDVRLRGAHDGVDLALELRQRYDLPVVFLTARTDPAAVERAKQANPAGYLGAPFSTAQLRIAIELGLHHAARERQLKEKALADGQRAVELAARAAQLTDRLEQIAALLADSRDLVAPARVPPPPPDERGAVDSMTRREREVIQHLLEGRRVGGISRELSLSVHTVRNHLRSAFKKMGVHSQEQLLEVLRDRPRR